MLKRRTSTRGLLWHDGTRVHLQSWTGDYSFEALLRTASKKRDGFVIDDGETKCSVEDIRPLQTACPLVEECPPFAASTRTKDRTYGYLDSFSASA